MKDDALHNYNVAPRPLAGRRQCLKASKRTKWTFVDLCKLAHQHSRLGNKWSILSKMFHKTDAQVKNIFHSIVRSKSGLEKCAVLYMYAKSIRGCADDPELRRTAHEKAVLSAMKLASPQNATEDAGMTLAASDKPVTAATYSEGLTDDSMPLALNHNDNKSGCVAEASISTSEGTFIVCQKDSIINPAGLPGDSPKTARCTALVDGRECDTGQSNLGPEPLHELASAPPDACATPLSRKDPTAQAVCAASCGMDAVLPSEVGAAGPQSYSREYDPSSDPLLLLRAHNISTRAAPPAPMAIGCRRADHPAAAVALDWRNASSLPALQPPSLESVIQPSSLGSAVYLSRLTGPHSNVSCGGWELEQTSSFVYFDGPRTGMPSEARANPVAGGPQWQLPSYDASTAGSIVGRRATEGMLNTPITAPGASSAALLQPSLQQRQVPLQLPQQQLGQNCAYGGDPFVSFLAELLEEAPVSRTACEASLGAPGVGGGGTELPEFVQAPPAPTVSGNACNLYGMTGGARSLWLRGGPEGQCFTAELFRCSFTFGHQYEGTAVVGDCLPRGRTQPGRELQSSAVTGGQLVKGRGSTHLRSTLPLILAPLSSAAATQLPSRHSAPAATFGNLLSHGRDMGYGAISTAPAVLPAGQAWRQAAATPFAFSGCTGGSLEAGASSGLMRPPGGLPAGGIPLSTSWSRAAVGSGKPIAWDGALSSWEGPEMLQPLGSPGPYFKAPGEGLGAVHVAEAALSGVRQSVEPPATSQVAFAVPGAEPAVQRGFPVPQPPCPLHSLLQGVRQAM